MARAEHEVATELERFGYKIAGKELQHLSALLVAGEHVMDGIAGMWSGMGPQGMFMTSTRLFSLPMASYNVIYHVYWHDVAQVQVSPSELRIIVSGYGNAGGADVQFSTGGWFGRPGVGADAFAEFADRLQRRVAALKSGGSPAQTVEPSKPRNTDLVSQLEQLAALRHQGYLTEEEFEAAKRKLLGT
jgi:hypothetical protein